jgi:hypothetical protein
VREKQSKMEEAKLDEIFKSNSLDYPEISHFLMCYKVKMSGENRFKDYSFEFINKGVIDQLKVQFDHITLFDIINALSGFQFMGNFSLVIDNFFEKYTVLSLKNRAIWNFRKYNEESWNDFIIEKMKKIKNNFDLIEGKMLQENIIYHLKKTNLSFIDIILKKDEKIMGIKVSLEKGDRIISSKTMKNFIDKYKIDINCFEYYFLTLPNLIDQMKI